MLNTLFNRLHLATGSGEISGLYDEIINNYNSGNLTQIFGNKGIDELYKRKRVTWHDFALDLDYLPVTTTTTTTTTAPITTMYFAASTSFSWDDSANWYFDADFLIPANRIPTDGDIIYIYGTMSVPPSQNVYPLSISIGRVSSSDLFIFNSNTKILCDINLYGTCRITGTSNSNINLYDNSAIEDLVCSIAYLYDNSYVLSSGLTHITDVIYLYDTSHISGGTFDSAIFYNSSRLDFGSSATITSLQGYDSSNFDGSGNITSMYLYDTSYVKNSSLHIYYAEFRNSSYVTSAYSIEIGIFFDDSYRGCVLVTSMTYNSSVPDKVFGCNDPLATNYNPLATCDDGSCSYIT